MVLPYRVVACLWLASILAGGCGSGDDYAERVARGELGRDFRSTVSVDGEPVLDVAVEYIGKEPGEPEAYHNSHDYRAIDTDFYRITFHNRCARDILVLGVDYRLQYGPFHGRDWASADSIRETWGTNLVPAGAAISRGNNFVYSRLPANTLYKRYRFNFADARADEPDFEQEIPLVYLQ